MKHIQPTLISMLAMSTLLGAYSSSWPENSLDRSDELLRLLNVQSAAQSKQEITESNWQSHPKIVAIRKIVTATEQGLKNRTLKSSKKQFQACGEDQATIRRIVRDSKGHVTMYEVYHEGREDSSLLYSQYYDEAGRLRFVVVTVYAANGTRAQHRLYFDEAGNIIWRNLKLLKGPGYFAPNDMEELPKQDPAKEFANDEDCVSTKPKRGSNK